MRYCCQPCVQIGVVCDPSKQYIATLYMTTLHFQPTRDTTNIYSYIRAFSGYISLPLHPIILFCSMRLFVFFDCGFQWSNAPRYTAAPCAITLHTRIHTARTVACTSCRHSLVGTVLGFCVISHCTFSVKALFPDFFTLNPVLHCFIGHKYTKRYQGEPWSIAPH